MGRARSPFHVIAFLLAIVLGWPWNVAFAAAESPSALVTTNQASWVARGGHRGRQVGRHGKFGQTACPAVSPDYEEDDSEEGNNSRIDHPWSLVVLAATLPGMVALPGWGMSSPVPRSTLRLHDLCRLRC